MKESDIRKYAPVSYTHLDVYKRQDKILVFYHTILALAPQGR